MKTRIIKAALYVWLILQTITILTHYLMPGGIGLDMAVIWAPTFVFWGIILCIVFVACMHILFLLWRSKRDAKKYNPKGENYYKK